MAIRKPNKYIKYIIEMREKHLTYEEIGEELGISRQYAQYLNRVFGEKIIPKKQAELFNLIVYKGLKDWMIENDLTANQFAFLCGEYEDFRTSSLGRFLTGQTRGNIELIRKILETTGLKFEEAFEIVEEKQCG